MAPLAVDPVALDSADAAVVSAGEGLRSVISTLTTALSGTAGMAGDDPAGGALGRSYDRSASTLVEAMVAARNGLCCIGDGVRMSAHNYSLAEAMSNVAGTGRRANPSDEEQRLSTTSLERKAVLKALQAEVFNSVPIPDGTPIIRKDP